MSIEKTILPSLRNIEWKTLKIETNKINHILPYMPTNNITELNEPIYAGVLAKEGRLKRYQQRVKRYRQNRTFQNNERKFYQKLGGSDTKTYQQPDIK